MYFYRDAKPDQRLPGLMHVKLGGSSYFMKSPPEQYTDDEARERTAAFIRGEETDDRRL